MELPTPHLSNTLRVVYEIVKRAPTDCPSKMAAVGASVLLVVASAVMARLSIANVEEATQVHCEDMCRECSIRKGCKYSLVK